MQKVNIRYQYDENDVAMLDALFAGIIRCEVLSDAKLEKEHIDNASKFAAQFADNIFQDEYSILYELAVTRQLTTGRWELMEAVIEENKKLIRNSPQVNLKYAASRMSYKNPNESDEYDAFISITKSAYERICNMPFPGAEGFRTACLAFIDTFKKKYTRAMLNTTAGILNSDFPYIDKRGGKYREWQGFENSVEFYISEKAKIEALCSTQRTRQSVIDEEWFDEQTNPALIEERKKRMELLFKLGIPEIDNHWSGVRRTRLINILGAPKGGKTTLAAFMVYRALMAGRRVAIWAMECTRETWINKLISLFCYYDGFSIDTKILDEEQLDYLPAEELLEINKARVKLMQSKRLSFIEEAGFVENFISVIDAHYRAINQFDLLVVDSPVNLQSNTGRRKVEYLSSAFMQLKDYGAHKLAPAPCIITTAQIKQEAIKEARNSVEITFDETSGGETAETIRTPNEVIAIFGTPNQKEVNRSSLHHVATRHATQFKSFELQAIFKHAVFKSLRENV
jgi:archaellum biogenesis ATPase FlaH